VGGRLANRRRDSRRVTTHHAPSCGDRVCVAG